MSYAEQQWLTLILVVWAVTCVTVLAAMLKSVVRYRSRATASPIFHAGTAVEALWIVVPVTIVVLTVILAVRLYDAGGGDNEVDHAVKAATTTEALPTQ